MAPNTPSRIQELFNSRRGRIVLENITAYLFLAPAGIVIFLFGLFPVAFAFFVSLHRWRRFPEEYQGLDNYVRAIGGLAYVLFFWLAITILVYVAFLLIRVLKETQPQRKSLLLFVPGASAALASVLFVNWFFTLLPVVLDVPRRLRGTGRDDELFVAEFFASFRFPEVLAAADQMWLALVAAVALCALALRWLRVERQGYYLSLSFFLFLALAAGLLLLNLTLTEINKAVLAAQEAGETLPIWSQIILISLGFGLLFAAYRVWQQAADSDSDRRFFLAGLATVLLVIGGYLLISELPHRLADIDRNVLQGFNVTVMYSLGTVPLQLTLGLGLAVLLFQNIKGRSFFRMVYFLPYITPFVATSIIFTLLFSHRTASPANQLLATFGITPQNWLLEPAGVFQLIFGPDIPEWLVGPGLALVVIIIYNTWVYTGFSTVIFLAGLGNIPREMYEAARIDGAGAWKSFRFITLPLLSPTTFFLILIATIGTFQAFTHIWLLRKPGAFRAVDTINIYIFEEIRTSNPNYAYGSAMAFVLFAVILALTLLQNRIVGRRVFYG
jgi:ABC-type sugar transport system permease subunit